MQSVKSYSQEKTPKRAQEGGGAGGGGSLPSSTHPTAGSVGPGKLRQGWTFKNRGLGGQLFPHWLSPSHPLNLLTGCAHAPVSGERRDSPALGETPVRGGRLSPCPWRSPYSEEGDIASGLQSPLPGEHRDGPGMWTRTSMSLSFPTFSKGWRGGRQAMTLGIF